MHQVRTITNGTKIYESPFIVDISIILLRTSFQIPRYIITLHELLAHTPPDHVEKNSLEQARVQLEDLSRQMHDEVINDAVNIRY